MKKEVFLAGSFQTEEGKEELRKVYNLLTDNGYNVWWAVNEVERCYGSEDKEKIQQVYETEMDEVRKRPVTIAVMKKASFGTAFEIKEASDNGNSVVGYLLDPENPDFQSGSFKKIVPTTVTSDEELLDYLKGIDFS
jgi:nucleoside 2-deoxyribosyltransferase